MQKFQYFVVYHNSATGIMKRMDDTVIDEDKILSLAYQFPHMRTMALSEMFFNILSKWNTEQTHPTIRYFYGPL